MIKVEPKTFIRNLRIVHLCFLAALIGITIYVYKGSTGFKVGTPGVNDDFLFLVPLTALFGYFGSQLHYRNQMRRISLSDSLPQKLRKYQKATLFKYTLIEVPSLLALYAFYKTDTALYFVIGLCLVAYLFVQGPKKSRLINEVPFSLAEKKLFDTLQT